MTLGSLPPKNTFWLEIVERIESASATIAMYYGMGG